MIKLEDANDFRSYVKWDTIAALLIFDGLVNMIWPDEVAEEVVTASTHEVLRARGCS